MLSKLITVLPEAWCYLDNYTGAERPPPLQSEIICGCHTLCSVTDLSGMIAPQSVGDVFWQSGISTGKNNLSGRYSP